MHDSFEVDRRLNPKALFEDFLGSYAPESGPRRWWTSPVDAERIHFPPAEIFKARYKGESARRLGRGLTWPEHPRRLFMIDEQLRNFRMPECTCRGANLNCFKCGGSGWVGEEWYKEEPSFVSGLHGKSGQTKTKWKRRARSRTICPYCKKRVVNLVHHVVADHPSERHKHEKQDNVKTKVTRRKAPKNRRNKKKTSAAAATPTKMSQVLLAAEELRATLFEMAESQAEQRRTAIKKFRKTAKKY